MCVDGIGVVVVGVRIVVIVAVDVSGGVLFVALDKSL